MLVLVIAASFLLVSQLNQAASVPYRDQQTVQALKEARAALLGFAATYGESNPGQPTGYLPCPDIDGDGDSDTANDATGCGPVGESTMGLLPWRTLGIPPLRDGAAECLWYAVSGPFKASAQRDSISSDTDGLFEIFDEAANPAIPRPAIPGGTKNRVIAIVFAPGASLVNQDRGKTPGSQTECGTINVGDPARNPANFLEALGGVSNATGDGLGGTAMQTNLSSSFISSPVVLDANGSPVFNDQLIPVTVEDFQPVFRHMDEWVANRVAACLTQYASANAERFPWADMIDNLDYDDDVDTRFGRIPDAGLDDSLAASGPPAAWPNDPDAPAPTQCFTPTPAEDTNQNAWSWWWWDAWQEVVFFAFDSQYAPDQPATIPPGPAPNGTLQVDSVGVRAAVVLPGRTLSNAPPNQVRVTNPDKSAISNYLEGSNSSVLNPGNILLNNGESTTTFNDLVVPMP